MLPPPPPPQAHFWRWSLQCDNVIYVLVILLKGYETSAWSRMNNTNNIKQNLRNNTYTILICVCLKQWPVSKLFPQCSVSVLSPTTSYKSNDTVRLVCYMYKLQYGIYRICGTYTWNMRALDGTNPNIPVGGTCKSWWHAGLQDIGSRMCRTVGHWWNLRNCRL